MAENLKSNHIGFKFDFDEWVSLAKNAPDEFDRKRRITLENLIFREDVNVSQLQGLQSHIDTEHFGVRAPQMLTSDSLI